MTAPWRTTTVGAECDFRGGGTSSTSVGGTGVNIKSLNQQTLSSLRIPYPHRSIQEAVVARLESISQETQRLESIYRQKLAGLESLKKSLLHQAFNGQL